MFYVYILYGPDHDRMYIGQTNSLEDRLARHNRGEVASTKPYRPWEMVYFEELETRTAAVEREKHWKKSNNRRYIREHFLKSKG